LTDGIRGEAEERVHTVLVVDDSFSMRQMLSFTLAPKGYEVIAARHGVEALQLLESKPVHLVITDLNMPEMDGLTLIRNLRQSESMRTRPILMLTTEAQAEKMLEGKQAGAAGWIVKPFEPEKLLQAVARVLQ
jgi:two-component system, chemotaxis family, chemotaxis protein CheY